MKTVALLLLLVVLQAAVGRYLEEVEAEDTADGYAYIVLNLYLSNFKLFLYLPKIFFCILWSQKLILDLTKSENVGRLMRLEEKRQSDCVKCGWWGHKVVQKHNSWLSYCTMSKASAEILK